MSDVPGFKHDVTGQGVLAVEQREQQAVQRGAEDAKNHPPSGGTAGLSSDQAGLQDSNVDVAKLSDKEFEALPASTKARMRGDLL